MKQSKEMKELRENGFVYVRTIDQVCNLQDESILEQILIDYKEVLAVDNGKAFKVFQLGGDE